MTVDPSSLGILHLVAYPIYSGPMEPTAQLALAQAAAGHRVWLGYDTKRGAFSPYEEAAAPRLEALGLRAPAGLTLSTKSSPRQILADIRRLRHFVREAGIDVVHVHMSHDHVLAAVACGRTVRVRTIHARRSLSARVGQRWLLRRADGWIVRCEAHREPLRAMLGGGALVEVVSGSIDTERWQPAAAAARRAARARFGIPESARLLVHAALIDGRGQEELAEAVARVNAPDLHVLFVGRGRREEALRQASEAQANVHFAGYLEGEALNAAYAAADAAFVAQPGNDASVRAVLEAMASGLPVIGVQLDAIAEVVDEAVGYAIANRQPENIAAALRRWLSDPDPAARGRAARQRMIAERRFDGEAAATVALYRRLIAAKNGP